MQKILSSLGQRLITWADNLGKSSNASAQSIPNLAGDRDIEWSWIASHIPNGPGEAIDFGPGGSYLGLIAAERGFNVTAIDLRKIQPPYRHPRLHFIQGDILKVALPKGHFNLVINCSTVEHVGLAGRYDVIVNRANGDLEAMACLRSLMKIGGVMLLTIPVGRDAVFAPFHRVYGSERFPVLVSGFKVEKEAYWVKNDQNVWNLTEKEDALKREPQERLYGLACLVLKQPGV